MSETEQEREEFDPTPLEAPGKTLAAARKKSGLELAAVSESIGVPQEVLSALEADAWDRLDAPVYVRGYLRKYARLLKLEEDAILAAYEANAVPHDPAIRAHFTRGLGMQRDVRWLIPVTGLIIVIVLILVGLWGWHHLRQGSSQVQAPAAAASAMMANGSATRNSPLAGASGTQAAAAATGAATGAQADAAQQGGIHLRLHMLKPSWVEVYGPDHDKLYYNLAAAGATLHFDTPSGPLSVFLGNASGVSLELNGEDFEIPEADITGNTARFELHLNQAPGAGTAQ